LSILEKVIVTLIKDLKFDINLKGARLIHFNQNWELNEQK